MFETARQFWLLIRLRYQLLWAQARTGAGRVALGVALYAIGATLFLFFNLGGIGAAAAAVRLWRRRITAVVLTAPLAEQLALRQMPDGLSAETQSQVVSAVRSSRYYGIAGTPVALLLKWSVLAFLIFSVSVMCGGDTSFRKSLSVLAHVSIVSALDSLAGVAVIYLLGTDASGPPGGAGPGTLSPAYFLGGDAHPALRAALENLTVFSVWGYALLALGIALTTRLTRGQSILVAGVVWGMQTAFLAGLALIFSRFGQASP